MKHILAVLFMSFTFLVFGQAFASTTILSKKSLDSISSPLYCADETQTDEKKKKKQDEEDEEPECD